MSNTKIVLTVFGVSILAFGFFGCGTEVADEDAIGRISSLSNIHKEAHCENGKVAICHKPPGNTANAHVNYVGAPAVKAHEDHHDDYAMTCEGTTKGDACDSEAGQNLPPNNGGSGGGGGFN